MIAPTETDATNIGRRQPRWSVNSLATAVLPTMLASANLMQWCNEIAVLRSTFASELRSLGLGVSETDANWVLVTGNEHLHQQLARHGVIVRDCTSFGLAGTFRLALPRPADLDRVLSAMASVTAS